jgi:phage recombination protein Bet
MNAVVEAKQAELPAPVARRGITEAQWRTAMNSLFPGAKAESVLMVFDYCAARKLDPLKKPCHIVPMQVKNADGDYVWRDVVMPGIYEYRTTAQRTGQYLGHSIPAYGPEAEFLGVKAPEYCDITVYRWNSEAKLRAEFPVRVKFAEVCGTAWDKKTGNAYVNARWTKAPQQMLTKCAEAAAIREAFPDEIGGTHTEEELAGQTLEPEVAPVVKVDPRGDISGVDWEIRDKWFTQIVDTLALDLDEYAIADKLREIDADLCKFDTLYIAVGDKLAAERIVSKAKWKEWLRLKRPEERTERDHGG